MIALCKGYHEYLNGAYWQLMDYSKETAEADSNKEEDEEEAEEGERSANPSPAKQKQQTLYEDPFSSSGILPPPPHPLSLQPVINSPYQRPGNPHLQASPDGKRLRPVSRPGYPYSLYGSGGYVPGNRITHGIAPMQNQETQCEG